MNVTFPTDLAAAVRAVAHVDDTDPADLVTMVVADWLATHHHRFRRAADALAALFPDPDADHWSWPAASGPFATDSGIDAVEAVDTVDDLDADADALAIVAAEHAVEHAVEHLDDPTTSGFSHLQEDGKTGSDPDRAAAEFITDAAGHACDHHGCTFVAKNANGLAIHRARKHPEPREGAKGKWVCCGQSFRSPQALGAHRRHRHPNRDTTADTRTDTPAPEPATDEAVPPAEPANPLDNEADSDHCEPAQPIQNHADGNAKASATHKATHNDTPNHPSDPLLDAPREPVELHTCEVCRSRVPSVKPVRGIGDCCRACAKDAA